MYCLVVIIIIIIIVIVVVVLAIIIVISPSLIAFAFILVVVGRRMSDEGNDEGNERTRLPALQLLLPTLSTILFV